MRNLFLSLLLMLSVEGFSQISLDFQTTVNLTYVKLNNSETKYVNNEQSLINNNNQFSLYNLDGTLYRTIQMPPKQPDTSASVSVSLITTTLFDNDSSTIEYLVEYTSFFGAHHRVDVIREDGTILLDEWNATTLYNPLVYSTEQGTKLLLYYWVSPYYQTKVFNLPGKLPNMVKEEMGAINNNLAIYPNPNNGSFFIKLRSKEGDTNFIDLYTQQGTLIDTFKSTGNLTHINKYGLSNGFYILNNRSWKSNSSTKMIIQK
jgi:Secretion system C-terminal sorting domain